MGNEQKQGQAEDFETDPKDPETFRLEAAKEDFYLREREVSDKDIFKLAKYILLAATLVYLIIATLRSLYETQGIKEVWEYSKVFLNSIISLVLGLYFGGKRNSR